MKARRTRQLEAVHSALREAGDHPTAAQLHARVRDRLPRVSLGTVYRNLEKLISCGEAIPVRLGNEPTRYDGMVAAHDHFVCEKCGGITDLEGGTQARIDARALGNAGYDVRTHSLTLFGVCRRCVSVSVAAKRGASGGRRRAPGRERLRRGRPASLRNRRRQTQPGPL